MRLPDFNNIMIWLTALLLVSATPDAAARSVVIATSGGDATNHWNQWRSKNLDKACTAFQAKGMRECIKVFDKDALLSNLRAVVRTFECGDTLILYFNGHGARRDGFVFDRESSRSDKRLLTEAEILNVLQGINCCAKVYVAFHSCYSGRYMEKLAEDPHVVVAVSSSTRNRKAHKKKNRRGVTRCWPEGFVEGFGRGTNLADAFQRGAQEGKAAAERGGYTRDLPQDFKRGHIKNIAETRTTMTVTLTIGPQDVVVTLPKRKGTNFSVFPSHKLRACMDISVRGKATFNNNNQFAPENPTIVIEAFNEGKFHVLEVMNRARKRVKVVIVDPPELCCAPRTLTLDQLPDDIAFCKYYKAKLGTDGPRIPTASGPAAAPGTPYPIEVKGHIIEADLRAGVVVIDMEKPIQGRRTLKLRRGETFPPWAKVCIKIELTGQLTGTEVREATGIDAQVETFQGHLDAFDAATGTMTVSLNGSNRDGVRNRTLPAKLQGNPGRLNESITPCKDISFRGRLRGDKIEDATSVNVRATN